MSILQHRRAFNDLGHPLCDNLRQGDWLMQYTVNRLVAYPATTAVRLPFIDDVEFVIMPWWRNLPLIRHDTKEEINVTSKAECDQLNPAHATRKKTKKKLKQTKRQCPLSSVHVEDL